MGGYDFLGSNSGIDLHKDFLKDSTWKRLLDGDALISIGTGHMNEDEANDVGIVPTHAYAVLDVREVYGLRLLQIKNPWSHKRWIGPYSHLDSTNWTPELMRELDYDRIPAALNDDGIFWIDFDSVCQYFDSIHMNWNPELFKYFDTIHSSWNLNSWLCKDSPNLGYNPQFCLEIRNDDKEDSPVFLLLSKHITISQENKEYITLHVYNESKGERIYYSSEPCWKQARFNAPPGISRYTVVVAQPGGNTNCISYLKNPQYCLSLPSSSPNNTNKNNPKPRVMLMLEGPINVAINVKLVWSKGKRVSSLSPKDIVVQSRGYQRGFCYCEIDDIKFSPIPSEGAGLFPEIIHGEWIPGVNAMGRINNNEYRYNPKITPTPLTNIKIFENHSSKLLGKEGAVIDDVVLPPREEAIEK
ncbi:7461_t:CDS:10 [Diversispora eburnea]|uniref:7461_t:CDS:1 n=1 Tax=Diversispora eburnea TaxID=1213867 RepID=A0A9N9G8W1_9GLOM|nr:7461_t:CDS:10 [Diversispora eburnea]